MSAALSDIWWEDSVGYGGMRCAFPPYIKHRNPGWGMPNYLRYRIKGGCYFFTVNLLERKGSLLVDHVELLRESIRVCKQKRPFDTSAWVVLPEHMHSTAWMQEVGQRMEQLPSIWTLPDGDDDFSNRWKTIKTHFSKGLPKNERRSKVRVKRGERGIWQRRFWD